MEAKRNIRLFFGRIFKQLSRAFGASLSSGGVLAVIGVTSRHKKNTEKNQFRKKTLAETNAAKS